MSSFKYMKKDNKVFISFANGRILIPWIERLVPKAESITVIPSSLSLSKSSYTIKVEGSYTLTATVSPEGADDSVVWSSANEEIATVSSGGKITGVAVGEVVITCASVLDSSVKATCTITVEAKE